MYQQYDFQNVLSASERVHWRVEDLIGEGKQLDFDKPFMPESLVRTGLLGFISSREKRTLNQIRGHGYLHLFGLVEEFILPFVLDHARARALLGFAAEEAKHIHLFKRFREDFMQGFGAECEVI
ncbi:MAG: hypothetical protein CL569_14290 [Alphaproteobacteria bacterium]|nr:hypothetical protein [Alphaproteobacteria bacterium]|tara:strand:- start:2161 stop:2532 length:372 start_codon:yes stop_codon:yes gene_type:complete